MLKPHYKLDQRPRRLEVFWDKKKQLYGSPGPFHLWERVGNKDGQWWLDVKAVENYKNGN